VLRRRSLVLRVTVAVKMIPAVERKITMFRILCGSRSSPALQTFLVIQTIQIRLSRTLTRASAAPSSQDYLVRASLFNRRMRMSMTPLYWIILLARMQKTAGTAATTDQQPY
jgi:hypothetical protein